jgi:SAM-dependent methyltransferase
MMGYEGVCPLCGISATFASDDRPPQNSYPCPSCDAPARYQAQAQILVEMYTQGASSISGMVDEDRFSSLSIYEPGTRGPFRRHLRRLPDYVMSAFGDDAAEGVRSEDLMALSFPDASFDLVITSDVFEHVRHPFVGFSEVHRILRPNGAHVFTVPGRLPLRPVTVPRVDVSGSEDVHLLEPVHHNGQHLVYNDFGSDLVEQLETVGFETEVVPLDVPDALAATVVAYRSVRTPARTSVRPSFGP